MAKPIEWWLATDKRNCAAYNRVNLFCSDEPELDGDSGFWSGSNYAMVPLSPIRFAKRFPDIPIPEPGTCRQVEVVIREPGTLDPATVAACARRIEHIASAHETFGCRSSPLVAQSLTYCIEQVRNLAKEGGASAVQDPPAGG